MPESTNSTPDSPPVQAATPSRWLGPTVGIGFIALMASLTYAHLVSDWHQLDWFGRLTRPIGIVFTLWVGIQLVRRRPSAYCSGMLFTGLLSIATLAGTIFFLIDPPGSLRLMIALPLITMVTALLTWLLWCDYRRSGHSIFDSFR